MITCYLPDIRLVSHQRYKEYLYLLPTPNLWSVRLKQLLNSISEIVVVRLKFCDTLKETKQMLHGRAREGFA